MQEFDAIAPIDVEYVPVAQASHALDPLMSEYDPAKHNTQLLEEGALDSVENDPVGQRVQIVDSSSEYDPGKHCEQFNEPGRGENVPALQLWHSDCRGDPVKEEYVPALHFAHALVLTAPVADEYFPAPHSVHSDV
jgi:hypothetical protein